MNGHIWFIQQLMLMNFQFRLMFYKLYNIKNVGKIISHKVYVIGKYRKFVIVIFKMSKSYNYIYKL